MQSQLLVDGKSFAIWAWGGGGLDSTSTPNLNCIDISTIPSLTYFMSVDFNPIWVSNPNVWQQSLWWNNHGSYLVTKWGHGCFFYLVTKIPGKFCTGGIRSASYRIHILKGSFPLVPFVFIPRTWMKQLSGRQLSPRRIAWGSNLGE